MQRTPRGVAAAISPGSPLRRADSMSPTNHSNPLYASTSPMGSVTSRRESDQRRAQEAGMSLLGLAFDGGHMTPPTARSPSSYGGSPVTHQKTSFGIAQAQYDEHLAPLEGVDPNLFMEGVKEHAKYLGMDPQRDNDMLWIARESLVAPMPTGWHQIMTKEGVPYYYNDHTGESRWEHPSDQDYMALYQEVMRMKLAGEPIDVSRLKYQFVQRQALNTHQHHGAGLHLDDAWARSGSSGSYHIDTPTDPHDGYNQGQYEAWSQSSAPSRRRRPHSSSHGKLEDVESEYDDEAHECTGEDIPYSPRDDDDNGSDIQVTTTRRGGAALDDMPDDGHRALVESLYAQLNECKTKLELQQQHQDVVDALQKSLYDITGQLEAHVKEVASANEALKAVQDELATAMRDKHTSAQHVIELEDALKQSRQQLVLAQGEVEIAKAKEAQDNLALRQEVKTLTMRLHDAETSAAVDEVQKQLKKETKLRFQWEQKFKSLEEQHQALMIQVNDANRKHELDRHVAQGDVETYQNELAQSKAKLASEIQTISDNHAHELERVKHAMGMRHAQEIDELTREHDKQLKALQTSENALLATVRALEADRLTQSAALADSATQLQAVQREAAQSTRRIKQLEASETANVKQIASLQAELDALKTSVQAQMDQAKQAGIAEATAKVRNRTPVDRGCMRFHVIDARGGARGGRRKGSAGPVVCPGNEGTATIAQPSDGNGRQHSCVLPHSTRVECRGHERRLGSSRYVPAQRPARVGPDGRRRPKAHVRIRLCLSANDRSGGRVRANQSVGRECDGRIQCVHLCVRPNRVWENAYDGRSRDGPRREFPSDGRTVSRAGRARAVGKRRMRHEIEHPRSVQRNHRGPLGRLANG
ncbi:hypothetical protein, variant 6 [Aphanomyces invadans]|uniref:WW domain-containing protein n=1 Tax=Aphanomyces invadans TaxID=157072 RepID=A0A024UL25_9STRA|nr:hypothetical protein, variant 6 [Aphanomyces invadans]XP_008864634.1 hypothetical protein, variant 4 [Aphanomyces invadans]XP_008864635.1 hypothetical protein, variant 5 [Aphanomyces invadans]ETW06556.1 hypothetical protein, variant 4 [Aphanomyces invadans]ETW06557.1 hypothetical protein, variant 5 [Aphanomyces invadans]ETW06558.1 hypothetical protein, variant 6 [Aphanomyces invadans]|eukprot:XP_008864631.1 hypothetical protein, variant 6 [Aphanomyces invadans]